LQPVITTLKSRNYLFDFEHGQLIETLILGGINIVKQQNYNIFPVWDLPTRLFHWVNVLCLIGLITVGTIILWGGAFDFSNEGKILI